MISDITQYSTGLGHYCTTTCPGNNDQGCGGDRLVIVICHCIISHIMYCSTGTLAFARNFLSLVVSPAPAKVDYTVQVDGQVVSYIILTIILINILLSGSN